MAIAEAVTAFGSDRKAVNDRTEALTRSLGVFSDEQRRLLDTAITSFTALQTGKVGLSGATGMAHFQCLLELSALTMRSLSEIRLAAAAGTVTYDKPGSGKQ
jgi:hypothetical protein